MKNEITELVFSDGWKSFTASDGKLMQELHRVERRLVDPQTSPEETQHLRGLRQGLLWIPLCLTTLADREREEFLDPDEKDKVPDVLDYHYSGRTPLFNQVVPR